MGKKGKKKPASAAASEDGKTEASGSGEPQQQPVLPVVAPAAQATPTVQQPQQVHLEAQPADVAQQPVKGPGKRKAKQQRQQQQQQQQEQQPAPALVAVAPTPAPAPQPTTLGSERGQPPQQQQSAPAPATAARGRGQGPQQQPYGRGQLPQQQQPPFGYEQQPLGRGQGPQQQPYSRGQLPQQQQPPFGYEQQLLGRGQSPQHQPYGRGQLPQQQQQPFGYEQQPLGRGQSPQQQPYGPGQLPQQQQQPFGYEQQPLRHGPGPQQQPYGRGQQQQQPFGYEQQPLGRGPGPQQQPYGRGQHPQQQQQPFGYEQIPPQQQPLGRGHGPPQAQQGGRGRGQGPHQQPFDQRQPPHQQQQPFGQESHQQQQPLGRGQGPQQQQQPLGRRQGPQQQQQPLGRGQGPQQQQQPFEHEQSPSQQHPAGRGAGRGRGRGAGPARSRQVSETSESSVGSPRRSQQQLMHPGGGDQSPQALDVSMKQMHMQGAGDQPTSSQQQPPPQQVAKKPPPSGFELAIPRRKNLRQGGTHGQVIKVETNHLALNINPKLEIAYHYDVAISPDKPKRLMRPVWQAFHDQYLKKYPMAFDDFRNAYSPTRVPDVAGEVLVPEDETSKPKAYKVLVRFAAEVNLRALFAYMASGCVTAVPQEALQCLDIVLRNASALRFVRVGRSYFSPPRGSIISLGDGLELWHGFFQSAVIGWKPFLNVDVAHKGFPKPQPVIDLFTEMSQSREQGQLEYDDKDRISKFMKGLKVQYEIPRQPASKKRYRVNSLVDNPGDAMFVQADGTRISVLNYFSTVKSYNIQYRRYPCLWVGPRERKIYLPAELCTILPGQVLNRKLNDVQTAAMVKNAATPTDRRKQKIMDSLRSVNFNADPVVRAFGLNVGAEFEKIRARWLSPPALEYRNPQRPVQPSRGVWRAAEFLQAQSLPPSSWTVINLDRRTRDESITNFARMLQQSARGLGMDVGPPEQPFPRIDRFDQRQFEDLLKRNKSSKKLLFVVVPDFPTNIYGKVKQAAELVVGCLTQCIKSKTMYKMNPATVGNILLKVNAKLDGQNHTIAGNYRPPCLKVPCMIMGADVTHPSPDQTDIPSVAAVTASFDPKSFRYNFSWRLQPARQEIIDDLQNIVREQLLFFYKKSAQKPQRLIFFRDGVSEGQFQEVMNMEVQAIRRACSSISADYRPPITFLVVQKRHHTRFFPTSSAESEDRNINVRAGTVVDTEITHPTDLEYYLVSHASIQGVARPTKYRVLWDDSNMGEDELEALTYYLCHMFSRCTRSVSYPAPTYYAHLAAFRARVYLEGHHVNLENLHQEQQRRIIKEEILRGLPMFFV